MLTLSKTSVTPGARFQLQWFGIFEVQEVSTRWPGFLLQDCRWLFLGPGLLSWIPFRSRHCCEEPGRVLVWIVTAATVTKVVEGCVYLRKRYYAFFGMLSGGEFELFALRFLLRFCLSSLSSNTTTINQLIRPRGGQGVRDWTLRTRTAMLRRLSCAPPLLFRGEAHVSVPMLLPRSLTADTH